MITIDANAPDSANEPRLLGTHPLTTFTRAAYDLAQATGEVVRLTFNNVSVDVTDEMNPGEAYLLWHETYSAARFR